MADIDAALVAASANSALGRLLDETETADLLLVCGDKQWRLHSHILALRSPFFRVMINSDMTEKKEGKIEVKEMDPKTMQEVINYMHGICIKIELKENNDLKEEPALLVEEGKPDVDPNVDPELATAIRLSMEQDSGILDSGILELNTALMDYESEEDADYYPSESDEGSELDYDSEAEISEESDKEEHTEEAAELATALRMSMEQEEKKDSISGILEAAERFQMDDLKEDIAKIVKRSIKPGNAFKLGQLADLYNNKLLLETCVRFIVHNTRSIKPMTDKKMIKEAEKVPKFTAMIKTAMLGAMGCNQNLNAFDEWDEWHGIQICWKCGWRL